MYYAFTSKPIYATDYSQGIVTELLYKEMENIVIIPYLSFYTLDDIII